MKKCVILMAFTVPMMCLAQQRDIEAVEQVIYNLFEGMYKGDSSLVHRCFSDDLRMYTTFINPDGKDQLRAGSLEGFLTAVGTPHDQIWNEKISNLKIDVDAGLAHAWMDYEFYLDQKFSHCGINAMQLVKLDGEWKIIHLIDTRKKSDCQPAGSKN